MNRTTARRTPPALGGYAAKQCPTRVYHDLTTDPSLAAEHSTGALARMEDGNRFEKEIGEKIAANYALVQLHGLDLESLDLTGAAAVAIPECDRSVSSKRNREKLTVAAMEAGVPVIWNARLPKVDGRTGEPDLLIRADEDQSDGRPAYHPVDVKHHKALAAAKREYRWQVSNLGALTLEDAKATSLGGGKPRLDDDMQLAHYRRMLEGLGFASGEPWGGVIGKEQVVLWRRLDEPRHSRLTALEKYDSSFSVVHAVAKAAVEDAEAGPLVAPEWKDECRECPWRVVCHDELVEMDHITLIPGITPRRAAVHYQRGVKSRLSLAKLDTATATLVDADVDVAAVIHSAKHHANGDDPAGALVDAAVAKSAGIETVADLRRLDVKTAAYSGCGAGLVAEIDAARVAKTRTVSRARGFEHISVPRARFEMDVDIEDADGRCYLIGVADTWRMKVGGSIKTRTDFHAFVDWTASDEGEARIFAAFWSYLNEQQEKAKAQKWGFRVYHYSDHETRYFRHLARKHAGAEGVPSLEELEAFLSSESWTDLYRLVKTQVVWPTEDLGLKTIAHHCGFNWRDDEPGGANSVAWYYDAVGADDEDAREAARQRVIDYNEDDVLATLAIRDWLTRFGESRRPGASLPSVESLEKRFRRPRRTVRDTE